MKRKLVNLKTLTEINLKTLITVFIVTILTLSYAQQVFPGIVVGDELSWESNELKMTLMVTEISSVTLGIYSPGFDPNDYRAEWRNLGRELGDERYDQGRGELRAEFSLNSSNQALANKSYGVESHRSDVLYNGTLPPGEYVLSSSFFGLGKNAFVYTFEISNPNALQIFIEPYQPIVDPRITNYNIARGQWQHPFSINNNTGRIAKVSIYDGDGPFELLFNLRDPSGGESEQPVSGDLQWLEYDLTQQGKYDFTFMVPTTAYQYTNTIGLRADCRLRLENSTFACVTPPRFQIDKRVVSAGSVCSGDTITYNITVSNTGGTWGLATLTEMWPTTLAGENIQQTFGLHPGESRSFTVQAQVLENANNQSQITNTATVSGKGGTASASATVDVQCAGPAKFTINKIADRSIVRAGETVNYTISVQNVGESSGVANVVDVLPNGLEGPSLDESIALSPGQTQTFALSARVTNNALGSIENCAILRSSVNNLQACATVTIPPQFEIFKEVNPTVAQVGETVRYTIRVRNTGGSSGQATLEDTLPTGLTGNNLNETMVLAAAEERTFTIDAQVLENAPNTVVNTAILRSEVGTLQAQATLTIAEVNFAISKTVNPTIARVGDTVDYTITVVNTGDSIGQAVLEDILPEGLSGNNLNETIVLEPAATQTFTIPAQVLEGAPERIDNFATLTYSQGVLQAKATLSVFDPTKIVLIKEVDPVMAEVGQIVTFILTARNASEVTREFTLEDILPEHLEGEDFFERFTLNSGEEREFTFNAKVLEGAPEEIINFATLTSEGNSATSTAALFVIEPPMAPAAFTIHKEAVREVVNIGDNAEFIITVTNTGGSLGEATLTDNLPESLLGENIDITFGLKAGETREFNISGIVQENAPEIIVNIATLESDSGIQNAEAKVRVSRPAALLDFPQSRFSEVDINFSNKNIARSLEDLTMSLVTHIPPEGATYKAGSSSLNGLSISDPFVDEQGRLYWLFPTKPEGSITYSLEHQGNLPPLAEPTLTIRTPEQDILVLGDVPFNDLEYFDLDAAALAPRRYLDKLQLISLQTNVGNSEPIEIGIQLPVEQVGLHTYITVDTNLEPILEDAEPLISGYQLPVNDEGYALLQLEPRPSVERLKLEIAYGEVIESGSMLLLGATERYYQYHLSISGRLLDGEFAMEGFAQGYAEWPIGGGTLQLAIDAGASKLPDEDFEVHTDRGLIEDEELTERFTITGSGNEAELARRSADGIAGSYSTENVHVGYYDDSPNVPAVSSIPSLTGLHAEVELAEGLIIEGFGALVADDLKREVFDLDGTRIYSLKSEVKRSSERVVLLTSKDEIVLKRNKDYSIDYLTGNIVLAKALWSSDKNFNPLRLQIDYAPETADRETFAFGGGVEYSNSNFTFGIGAVNLNKDNDFEFGARLGYSDENFTANLGYIGKLVDDELESTFTIAASAQRNISRIESDISLSYNVFEEEIKGRGRLAYNIFSDGWIALEHNAVFDEYNLTSLTYEQYFFDNFGVGAGLGYNWEDEVINGVIRGLYKSDDLSLNITHAQPFNSDEKARSDVTADYQIDENLSADATLSYLWDEEVIGTVGLNQRIGDANLSLDYQLPTASGTGNRARFGVAVPLPVTDEISTDFSGGYERDIDSEESEAAFGVAVRYDDAAFNATVGGEVSIPSDSDTKVTLRAGASGQLTDNQIVSVSANYQVAPELNGRANIGYAYRGSAFSILTYHNLTHVENSAVVGEKNLLEGELAFTYALQSALQLRPGFAYRIDLDDNDNSVYQFSLGAIYYLNLDLNNYKPTVGLGGHGSYRWQPGTDSSAWGATVEAKVQILEPVWISLGYTFTDSSIPSVDDDFSGGLVLRLDIIDAWQSLLYR